MLARRLFPLARWSGMGPVVALGLRYAGQWLPLRRVWWSRGLIGFYHPRPAWCEHMVLVLTTPIRDLLALGYPSHARLFADVMLAAGEILRRSDAAAGPYVLCANGGVRQDVQQVHFHLLRGERWVTPVTAPEAAARLLSSAKWDALLHPEPAWETHVVVVPKPRLPALIRLRTEHAQQLVALAAAVPMLHRQLELRHAGYTVVIQGEMGDERPLELHLIAGDEITGRILSTRPRAPDPG